MKRKQKRWPERTAGVKTRRQGTRSATARASRRGNTTKTRSGRPTQRADALLRTMTIEEKAMQLSSVFPLALFDTKGTNHSQLDAQLKNGIGHVSALGLIGHKTPEALAKAVNAFCLPALPWSCYRLPRK
jgi:hypothetical protein